MRTFGNALADGAWRFLADIPHGDLCFVNTIGGPMSIDAIIALVTVSIMVGQIIQLVVQLVLKNTQDPKP